jgi:hypothetical protein
MTTEPQHTEEEMRAAYEAEIKKLRIEQLLLEHIVSVVNLGMRRTGLAPGTEDERDVEQVRIAIEAVRALLPLIEHTAPDYAKSIREALSQLQLAFVRIGGQAEAGAPGPGASPGSGGPGGPGRPVTPAAPGDAPESGASQGGQGGPPPKPGEPGPAQRSGRLWIPGQ